MKHYLFILFAILLASTIFAQTNTWSQITDNQVGYRVQGALVYEPDSDRFHFNLGSLGHNTDNPYADQMFNFRLGKWINHLPNQVLYGLWADSTGNAYGMGTSETSVFGGSPYFIFRNIPYAGNDYLRPHIHNSSGPLTYLQYAYNKDDTKIYYYMNSMTFTYDTRTRMWDTLSVTVHPASSQGGTSHLLWGSMCYDPVNQEIVLFGGAGADVPSGNLGTWIFDPATTAWSKPSLTKEPGPRALSPMVYDPASQSIVLFGGDKLDALLSDTWVYSCATRTWEQKSPAVAPSPRAGHALIRMPKSGKIVLLGGFNYTSCTEYVCGQYASIEPFQMWSYDVSLDEWTLIKAFGSSDTVPKNYPSIPALAAADSADNILALAYTSRYNADNKTYKLVFDPSGRDDGGKATYGVASGTLGLRTGTWDPAWYSQGVPAPNPDSIENFLKNIPTNTWIKMGPPKTPQFNFDWGTTIYSPDHDVIMKWSGGHSAYGGTSVMQYSVHNDRWAMGQAPEWPLDKTYSNTSYPPYHTFSGQPFMRGHTYDNYSYDVNLKKLLLHKSKYSYTYDPVRLDWDRTQILNDPDMGGSFYNTSLTSTVHGAFAWLRMARSGYGLYLFNADSMAWQRLTPTGGETVPVYYSEPCGAAYDSKRDRILMASNNSEAGQLWAYNFNDNTLEKLNPTGTAVSGILRECVYLPAQDQVLYAGNLTHRLYDCASNSWQTFTATKGSGVGTTSQNSSGYNYDPNRDLVWDCEQRAPVYVMRVAGGYDPDSLPPVGTGNAKDAAAGPALSVYPNPFNGIIAVSCQLSAVSKKPVPITLYGVNGKMVKKLLANSQQLKAGINWNASDLASGVYLIRAKIGNKAFTKKIILQQ